MKRVHFIGIFPLVIGVALFFVGCNSDEVIADYTCNNNQCEPGEDHFNCPDDCEPPCGDDVCEAGEDHTSCPEDCTCGDSECQSHENAVDCPGDCAGPQYPGPCSGDSTALSGGYPGPGYLFLYEMIGDDLRITEIQDHDPPDGVGDLAKHWRFDADGKLTAYEWDSDNDGVIDAVHQYQYDGQGRFIQEEIYDGEEGPLQVRTTHHRDGQGLLTSSYTEAPDPDYGGNKEILYEWNGDQSLCTELHDKDANGTVDSTRLVTYDSDGLILQLWDSLHQQQVDFNWDYDNLWSIAPWAYTQLPYLTLMMNRGRLLSWTNSELGPKSFFYDEHGNLLWKEAGSPEYPEPTHYTTFDYSCWEE